LKRGIRKADLHDLHDLQDLHDLHDLHDHYPQPARHYTKITIFIPGLADEQKLSDTDNLPLVF
jgi:hypothetical protein